MPCTSKVALSSPIYTPSLFSSFTSLSQPVTAHYLSKVVKSSGSRSMGRQRPRSFMEWVVGCRLPDFDEPLPNPKPKVSEQRLRSATRHVLVHVETSDSDCTHSYSSDDSSASTPKKKKVHFEDPPKKSALKKRSYDKENEKNKRDACEYCSCSCSECESKAERAKSQKYEDDTQQTQSRDNHNNKNKNNQTNQRQCGQAEQRQGQIDPGISQNRNYTRTPYQANLAAARNLQARLAYMQSMASRTVQPCRAIVVLREDVIECPSDPRPNAFFDAQTGIMRVYHGTVYGNPYATLMPNPSSHVPIGSFAPPAARSRTANANGPYSHGARQSSTSAQPTTNNNWANPQNENGTIPGSWPNENNEGPQGGSGWNSNSSNQPSGNGWGNNNSNNNNSSSWGGDGWGENNQNSKSSPNNNNSTGWGGDGGNNEQSNSWGSGGNEGSNDNQQNDQSWGDNSNDQSNNNPSQGDNANNNTSPDNNSNNSKNEDAWGQPKTAASWGDMSAAQSTQGNGNNNNNNNGASSSWGSGNGNQQNNQTWADNSNNQSNNNANGTWTSAGNSRGGGNNNNNANDSWGPSGNGATTNDNFSGW